MVQQLIAFAIVIMFACSSAAKPPKAGWSIARMELHKSIARVSMKAGAYSLTATAFAIHPNYLLTAGHVCSDAQSLAIQERVPAVLKADYIDDEDLVSSFEGLTIVKMDAVNDLCLLFRPFHPLKPLEIEQDPKKVKRFDRIFIAGAPWGEFPMLEECFVSSRDSEDQKSPDTRGWLSSSCSAKPGYSGGPIIRAGKVVSVISRGKAVFWPIGSAYITFGSTTASILEFSKFIK
jgi:hypothetical protein